jgi:WD40 repeat protein
VQSRYQIHSHDVSAVDCSPDGPTMVSGGSDGHIVLWSHITGFKLAVLTAHSAAIRCLSFNHGEEDPVA